MNARGDILIYGCDVSEGSTGLQLIDSIAKATGADVAASRDLTGAARLGGNWTLEDNTGNIEAQLALAKESMDA